jgi:hypothetical protein
LAPRASGHGNGAQAPQGRREETGTGEPGLRQGRHHPDKRAPTEPADSRAVPGRSCLSTPTDWERVSSVFSFRLQHLHCITGIPHNPRALQIVCNASQTIVSQTHSTSVERCFITLDWRGKHGAPIWFSLTTVVASWVWWNCQLGVLQAAELHIYFTLLIAHEGEMTHCSKGWHQRLRPDWPQRFARRTRQSRN